MDYIRIYQEHFHSIRRLDDRRAGQVLKAVLAFSETGTLPEEGLDEAQLVLLDFIVDKLKRDEAAYRSKCGKLTDNGRKGGRPRKAKAPAESNSPQDADGKNQMVFEREKENHLPPTQPNQTKPNQTKPSQTEDNQTDDNRTQAAPSGAWEEPSSSFPSSSSSDAVSLSTEERECLRLAQDAGFAVETPAARRMLLELNRTFGPELMGRGIEACVTAGIVTPGYLKGALTNMRDNVPKPSRGGGAPGHVPLECRYEQREYDDSNSLEAAAWR